MTTYRPATPHSNSIKRPKCSKCGTPTLLFGLGPQPPATNWSRTSADRNQEMHVWDCPWRATTEVTREPTMPYRIRVTPKTGGDRLHVFGLRNGPTPKIGVELDVILGDRRIRARVTNIHLPVSKMDGASVDEVYANEI
jgi:hypothetical protein